MLGGGRVQALGDGIPSSGAMEAINPGKRQGGVSGILTGLLIDSPCHLNRGNSGILPQNAEH